MKQVLFLLVIFISLIAITSSSVFATTHQISNGMNSKEIQNKIDNAKTGDTLNFTSGGTWKDTSLTINKYLNIQGNGAKITTNSAKSIFNIHITNKDVYSGRLIINNFNINAKSAFKAVDTNKITLKNLNINGIYNDKNSIEIENVQNILLDNILVNNSKTAININGGSNIVISGSHIVNSVYAVYFVKDAKNINILKNNFEKNNYGLFFGKTNNITAIYNYITNNSYRGVSISKYTNDINIDTNAFRNNPISVYIEGNIIKSLSSKSRNITINNNCLNISDVGIFLKNIHDNDVYNDIKGFSTNRYGHTINSVLKSLKLTGGVKLNISNHINKKI